MKEYKHKMLKKEEFIRLYANSSKENKEKIKKILSKNNTQNETRQQENNLTC